MAAKECKIIDKGLDLLLGLMSSEGKVKVNSFFLFAFVNAV